MSFSKGLSMSPEGTAEYINEIGQLKLEYANKIDVYCGLEFELYSDVEDFSKYDYAIDSVHLYLQCFLQTTWEELPWQQPLHKMTPWAPLTDLWCHR